MGLWATLNNADIFIKSAQSHEIEKASQYAHYVPLVRVLNYILILL